jgi:aspartate 1-decarboxylase
MLITKLKSKLHRVTTTDTHLHYEGSCAIDEALMEAANIQQHEQIHIYNVNNGNRFTTYAIKADADSGIISVRGSAARLAMPGDILIICTYGLYSPEDESKPLLVYVNLENNII